MKKGFTMIELIFVIVILGILASVAIPRLAATREDAEIATTIANLRTLLSDASSYHVAKGNFDGTKWKDLTNVPLKTENGADIDATTLAVGNPSYLAVGGGNCLQVSLRDGASAYIAFGKVTGNSDIVCTAVLESDLVKQLLESTLTPDNDVERVFCAGIKNNAMSCIDITPSSIY